MTTGNYFFDDGKSRKFWSYTLAGKQQTIRHGRLGTAGKVTTKTFPSASAAQAATDKLVSQKLGKGYIQVDPSRLKFHRDKKRWKRPATRAEVARLEKRIKAKLPADYKEFLLSQNGGLPENGWIGIPGDPKGRCAGVGEIYGLYDEPKGFSLLWALDKVQPRLPAGHLPISGWLDFCSLSLDRNPGCVYLWDDMASPRPEDDADGNPIFTAAHAVLVAGSFNEFLTRVAIYKNPEEGDDDDDEQPTRGTAAKSPAAKEQKAPRNAKPPKLTDLFRDQLLPAKKTGLSHRRQAELLRLTYEGGDELTAAIEQGEEVGEKFRRRIHREIMQFLKDTKSKHELQFFVDNWHWDSGAKPLLALVKHPHVDAGTLLQIFWNGSAEDYYLFHRSAAEIKDDFDRGVFEVLVQIERRFVKGDFKTATFPFDPTERISMPDRRSEFARPIPDVLYQPIRGGKSKISSR